MDGDRRLGWSWTVGTVMEDHVRNGHELGW